MRATLVLAVLCEVVACGRVGGGVSSGAGGPLASGPNVVAVSVNAGPAGTVNTPFVTVSVCMPGTSTCQQIDNVLVDTGSSGLRLIAEALPAGFDLPGATATAGDALFECEQFADGYAWGSVRTADVRLSGEQASSLPVQLIGDPAAPTVPADCASGPPLATVQSFGANGVLGISVFREDCGAVCETVVEPHFYYGCMATVCQGVTLPVAQQLQNPVSRFALDNNGAILQLLSVDPAGQIGAMGALIFGIGTQTNNGLGSATTLAADAASGTFTTTFAGQSLAGSGIDSGSNALFFPDTQLTTCTDNVSTGFYCPASVQLLQATLGASGKAVSFSIANATALLQNQPSFSAYENLGGPTVAGAGFDWGLPFFYGRKVFVAIEGQNTPAGVGPFFAF
jgi:hypothetical protein